MTGRQIFGGGGKTGPCETNREKKNGQGTKRQRQTSRGKAGESREGEMGTSEIVMLIS